jgi:hypothetical protein
MRIVAALLLCTAVSQTAVAEYRHRVALLGAGEVWLYPEKGGHGIGIVGYDLTGLPLGSHLGVELNTDTLRVRYDRLKVAGGWLSLGAQATGQVLFAGLLNDYYRLDERDPARGFWASYFHLAVFAKANLPAHNYLQLQLGVRRWFFNPLADTDTAVILPPEAWVFEGRLQYTGWWLKGDPSLRDRSRLFGRLRGFALGVDVGIDVRSEVRPWGARDPTVFSPVDPRNDPKQIIVPVRQWFKGGWQLHPRVRSQVLQVAAYGYGEDDLTRMRVGGMNPYVVPIAGAPWAAFLSERLVALEWSWHFRFWREMEAGVLFDGAVLEDIERVGSDAWGWVAGVGVFLDMRIKSFQVDVRGGWSPTMNWQSEAGQFSAFVSFGWVWDKY